jgi:uroporphyrin-III C-methyltransferase
MGVSQLEAICSGLSGALPAHTPAALVQGATTAAERRLVATLGTLPVAARHAGIGSPAVLIVGDVLHGVAALAGQAPGQPFPPVRGSLAHCPVIARGSP